MVFLHERDGVAESLFQLAHAEGLAEKPAFVPNGGPLDDVQPVEGSASDGHDTNSTLVESGVAANQDNQPTILLGHGWALDCIERGLKTHALTHAYLLTGWPHVGKFTTALAIARLLLCPAHGCGACRHCRLAALRAHPDLRVLEIPPERRNIPLRDVHEFMQGIALRPLEADRKVYVIRDAEDLLEEGASALLKTLEEPPRATVLLLTAPDPAMLLPTVVSRCQVIALRPVAIDEITAHLRATYKLEVAQAEAVARGSEGRPGWAILAAQNPAVMAELQRAAGELLGILSASRLDRIAHADALAEQWGAHSGQVRETLDAWRAVWRDLLLVQEGLQTRIRHMELAQELSAVAQSLTLEQVRAGLASTLRIGEDLERNASPRLALEAYALLLPRINSPSPTAVGEGQ